MMLESLTLSEKMVKIDYNSKVHGAAIIENVGLNVIDKVLEEGPRI